MSLRAAVAGASGYAGGELLRLLLDHPVLDVATLAAGSAAGSAVADVHPHLPALTGRTFSSTDPVALASADVTFLALPPGESARLVPELRAAGVTCLIDLGADHRLRDPADWQRWYAATHPFPAELGSWPYGLPELAGARRVLSNATQVAVPGCYPTAVTLALAPLLAADLIEAEDVVVVASSGTSGAGRAVKPSLIGSEVLGDLTAYKVGVHQHTPEIVEVLTAAAGRRVGLSFTAVLAPMPRGILAISTARLRPGVDEHALRAALSQAYDAEAFVHLLPAGRWPHTAATLGSNSCHLQVTADRDAGRAVVVSAIDNLGKGAAGQALQCANLALGLDERAGLTPSGVAP
ncbi:MAG TPA: N-acetyl-gamma-glutamyl-phosphate reductase [Mycobacteriales bacterium]|nr:N-acetyl-gamma-glutamyl-phosphate reductase [Mycobacteriales bacterium]